MNDGAILSAFGERVRAERVRLGKSQEQLAHADGLDRTYVSDVERGSRNLGLRNVAALAVALQLEPADLLRPAPVEASAFAHAYRYDPTFRQECGFVVNADDMTHSVLEANTVLRALPAKLFQTVDLKTQSGIVGAVLAAALASRVGAIVNPIEKGHPDVLPASAAGESEARLRNYPLGLEIKCTIGGVTKGSNLRNGCERISVLSGVTWQAHHRGVRSLLGLVWDFLSGTATAPAQPAIAGVFFAGDLVESDWGAISGTTGRNTKVTGMLKSGQEKMGRGALLVIEDERYLSRYARLLHRTGFPNLTSNVTNSPPAA